MLDHVRGILKLYYVSWNIKLGELLNMEFDEYLLMDQMLCLAKQGLKGLFEAWNGAWFM